MSDLAAAAAALGVPEAIVRRSAEARAKATGASVDEVLAAWAGGGEVPEAKSPAAPPPESASQEAEEGRTEPEAVEEGSKPVVESPERVPVAATVGPPPPPGEVSPKEAVRYPVVVTVPTAGLSERTAGAVPWWLAAFLVIIPLFGLLQLAGAANNECGLGGELLPDRVTGELRNCDGTEFEGRGPAGGGTDFLAMGAGLYTGEPACAGCHGGAGEGGTGPALTSVLATFSTCLDHIEWVTKGTAGFQAEGRTTYGDLGTPVGASSAVMPSFGTRLSAEQLAAVVTFERVRLGGAPLEETLADCGLAAPAPEEGAEAPAEAPAEEPAGETGSTTTAP
jgi:mono/diheme cytochrome c family protein